MSFEARCPQCLFLTRQLGTATACLLHVSLPVHDEQDEARSAAAGSDDAHPDQDAPRADEYDEPYAFGQLRPTVDRPGPFSLREYVRLQLLRTAPDNRQVVVRLDRARP